MSDIRTRIWLSSITVDTDNGPLRYTTNVLVWNDIKALARNGIDADGRKILNMEITNIDTNSVRTYSPEVINEFPEMQAST